MEYVKAERLYSDAAATYAPAAAEEGGEVSPVDFEALKAINPEIIAWLIVDGTEISYPVAHTTNNEKYLKTAYDGSKSNSGTIFMNSGNRGDFLDQNTLIYGHHMRDNSMFGKLMNFEDPNYLLSHRTFTVYTPQEALKYEIFSAFVTYSASFVYTDYFEYSWEFADFIQKSLDSSVADMGVEVTENDKIVTLSTCTSRGKRSERFVVQGKLIQ